MNIDTLFTLSYLKLPIKEFLLMFLTSFNDNSAVEVDERETNVAFIARIRVPLCRLDAVSPSF